MKTWAQFAEESPDLAAFGKARLEGRIAYLATIRPSGAPRLHPVSPVFTANGLFVYMSSGSPKASDLRRDPRYSVHCSVEDHRGGQGEFLISGCAFETVTGNQREEVFRQARIIGRNPLDSYVVFEFRIREAAATIYGDSGPRRTIWKTEEVDRGNLSAQ
ncbi:MAG TPA: pyridoxamine 5'-phosphate oxidase family protein [Blastocatellia bacterium]|nr:pyridoxamine 5'-phosphate oxidase family protein [Blastocatellia bacterium]